MHGKSCSLMLTMAQGGELAHTVLKPSKPFQLCLPIGVSELIGNEHIPDQYTLHFSIMMMSQVRICCLQRWLKHE